MKDVTWTSKETVGETTHRDASGRVVGTSETTRDVLRSDTVRLWDYYQGNQIVDEQDFYRLIGDRHSYLAIKEYREQKIRNNRIALWVAAGGAAATGGAASVIDNRNVTGILGAITLSAISYAWIERDKIKKRRFGEDHARRSVSKYEQTLTGC